jgi:hypothetical protein
MANNVARVGSVAKAARVLQAFTPLVTSLSLRQVAERTGSRGARRMRCA